MLQVRANVPNADGALLPGMYLSVSVASGAARSLVTIPQAAVAYNPYGALVYVVHDEKDAEGKVRHVVKQQFVTTGEARGDQVSILKGVGAERHRRYRRAVEAAQRIAAVKIDNTRAADRQPGARCRRISDDDGTPLSGRGQARPLCGTIVSTRP